MLELGNRDRQALTTRANILLPGLYAWLITVVFPATSRGVPLAARILAVVALFGLLSGSGLVLARPRLARALGIHGFVASSLATWIVLGPFLSVERLDPVRSALGGVGWVLFALGWGTVRRVGTVPEDDPHVVAGTPLTARAQLPRGAVLVLAVAVFGTLVPLMLAWRIDRPDRALLAQAVALLCSLAIIHTGGRIALGRGHSRPVPASRQRLAAALRPLVALAVMLGLGLVLVLLR